MSAAFKKSVTLLTYTVEVPYPRVGTTISPKPTATWMANMTDHPSQGGRPPPGGGKPYHIELGVRTKFWCSDLVQCPQNQTPKTKPPNPNPELPLSKLPLLFFSIYDTKRAAAIPFPITLISVLRFASTSFLLS